MTVLLLAASFVLIIGGALLFANAVEWAGRRLGLGHGAVGSVIAAVAIGSIVGAPLLLGTLAMAMVGTSAVAFRGRRQKGSEIDADAGSGLRDLIVFALMFSAAVAVGATTPGAWLRYSVAGLLVAGYTGYVWWTVRSEPSPHNRNGNLSSSR